MFIYLYNPYPNLKISKKITFKYFQFQIYNHAIFSLFGSFLFIKYSSLSLLSINKNKLIEILNFQQ